MPAAPDAGVNPESARAMSEPDEAASAAPSAASSAAPSAATSAYASEIAGAEMAAQSLTPPTSKWSQSDGMDEPDRESPPWSTMIKGVVAASTIVLIVIIIWRFRDLLQPLIFAAILAYLLNPLVSVATRRFRMSRGQAVGVVYGGFILVSLGLLAAIGIIAFSQADRLATTLPSWLARVADRVQNDFLRSTLTLGPFSVNLAEQVNDQVLASAADQVLQVLGFTPARGGQLAASLFNGALATLSSLFIIMFVAIYLSKDGPMLWASARNVMRAPGYHYDAERLGNQFMRIWDAYLRGQVMLALSMFVLVSMALTILGVNYSLALGGLAGLLEFLPVLGPTISTAVAVLVALFQDSNWMGLPTFWYILIIIVVMVALQQLEQAVLVPRFVGQALDLHALIVIVAVLMGTSLAGILGAVLAAPVAATAKLIGAYGWRKMFDLPPFPEPEPPEAEPDTRPWRERLRTMWSPRTDPPE